MSCNYADGLSPYEHKGVLGIPEKFDSVEKFNKKCDLLAQLISQSKHIVVHTGAGISTSAGIPDFRGPNGVWTLEKEGRRPSTNVSFADAEPTKSHMILKKLVEIGKVHYIVSQNIDGLHLKSGLPRKYLSELHGNMFIDECNVCKRQFVRSRPVETVGKKCSGVPCGAGAGAGAAGGAGGRPCRGRLYDGVLDWEHALPDNDLLMAECHSSIADLSICLGTTLQIIPSGNLPLETVKYGGKLVICNLQPTKHDNKADLVINYYVDDVLARVMNILNIDIPPYNESDNLTRLAENSIIDWTINRKDVLKLEKIYKIKCKGVKKKRNLIKNKRNSVSDIDCDYKAKIIKVEVKEECASPEESNVTNGELNVSITESCVANVTHVKSNVTNGESNVTVAESNVTNAKSTVTNAEFNLTDGESNITKGESQRELNVTNGESNVTVAESNVTNTGSHVTDVNSNDGESNLTTDETIIMISD